mgnify:FL=1
MNKKTAKEIEEEIYLYILGLAEELYKDSQLMSLEELLDKVNKKYTFNPPNTQYVNITQAVIAAKRRAMTEEQKEAISKVFIKKDGSLFNQNV